MIGVGEQVGDRFGKRVIAIVGPTAVGKTAVGIELVSLIGGEIVSADSMAVYKGMDVGTAKPTREERGRAVFHLIDIADPARGFSVGEFQQLAHKGIDGILELNPPAIVVGGSGLYVRAAVDGLGASVPPVDPAIRRNLVDEARRLGKERVHARLASVDPKSAMLIHPNNLKRVIRALEIWEITGVPASDLFEADAVRPSRYEGARFFGLTMERKALYARIEERVDSMVEAGLLEEVRSLLDRGVDAALPSMQGLGYKEIAEHLQGRCGLEDAVALLKKNTRRFAKRQYTWFRADRRVMWIDTDHRTAREVSQIIKELM